MQDKTIRIVPHEKCTGCGACYNKCPKNAIKMKLDSEGFLFPEVQDDCVSCGACQGACPVLNPVTHHDEPESYAVWAADSVRLVSSSGGMFSLLANEILNRGGVVFGAAYAEDYQTVHHIIAKSKEELAPLRGSKYVQSNTELTYRKAKAFLDKGVPVLYTGCPCQIAGLYRFLGKTYPQLYTADLVCHGSNSIKAYQSFLKEFTSGKEIEKVDFRDKKFYTWSTPTVVYLKDGEVRKAAWNEGTWYKGFLEGVVCRLCCGTCEYATSKRIADITLADCWQVYRINKLYDDKKGTSLVLVNSDKGKSLFEATKFDMKLCKEVPLDVLKKYNGCLVAPTTLHKSRKYFFNHLDEKGYHKALWYGRGMRFDFGVVGWWFASNYGSSLTYYALGKTLESLGKQILLIPLAKRNGTPWEKETQQTIDFLGKYFKIGKSRDYDEMPVFNDFCDAFIVGSDQLWTAGAIDLLGYTFFLDFVQKDKKKIAFSTSFGQSTFQVPKGVNDTAKDYLQRFNAVSVRESSGVDLCKEYFGVDAAHIMDPVFLCEKQYYDELVDSVNDDAPEKYLLCYILDPTPEKERLAAEIARKKKLKIITILGMKEFKWAKDKWHMGQVLQNVTSEQFLFYIKNSDYLLTDSHHGTCFGIIYEKPYLALVNSSRGATRFESVAEKLGLKDRLVYTPYDLPDSIYDAPIDYESVEKKLSQENARSLEWLKDAINSPEKHNPDTVNTISADFDRKCVGLENKLQRLKKSNERKDKEIKTLRNELNNIAPSAKLTLTQKIKFLFSK